MTRTYLRRVVLCVTACLVLFVLWPYLVRFLSERSASSNEPSLASVQEISAIVTHRVNVSRVHVEEVRGQLGATSCLVKIHGDVLISVDFMKARFMSLDRNASHAVLELPSPAITGPRVDHERSHIYGLTSHGIWKFSLYDPTRLPLIQRAFQRAQQLISEAGREPHVVALARDRAERLIGDYGKAIDWTIEVHWRDDHHLTPTNRKGGN